jgi:CheY-like chemotaxis protein
MAIIYKEIISKHTLNKLLEKNKKILNSQKSIIIITNGIEIFESNKTLLDFFEYQNLDEFKQKHSCICDMFKEEEGKNYIQKQMKDKNWYQYILENHIKENKVMMIDTNNKKHIFKIEYQEYDKHHNSKIFTFIDITQIETLNYSLMQKVQETEELIKLKSEFLANMSHEIRTPMNAIIGMSHLALLTKLDDKQKHYIEKIDDSAKSLLGIINDILDFSKIEAGKLTIEKIDFDLFETVDKVIDLISFKAHDKNLELIVSYDRDVGNMFYGDKLRISQILTNLLGNAVKFTDFGEIGIYISKTDKNRVRFEVKDTGIGLSQKAQDRLFNSFSQADGSVTRKYGGTGLGLSISKQLTELMDGKIWVESNLGEGSSFIFEIKLEDKNFTHEEFTHFKNKRILIVDDNKSWHEILTNSLKEFDIEVDCVLSGDEAIETVINSHGQYDLILMDWNMPYLNGIDTAQKIHKICEEKQNKHLITIVMVSAFRQESIVKSAKEIGIDIFLQKPINPSILNNVLRSVFLDNVKINYTNPNENRITKNDIETLSGSKILLVEDNITNQEIIVGLLEDSGIQIDIASNGKEGVDMFEKNSYELILMDIQMPIMEGYEATRRIRAKDKNIPIIALSANAMQKDRDRTLKEGMNAHLNKPIIVEELYTTLLQYISKKKDISTSKPNIDKDDIEIPNFKTIDTKIGLSYLNNNKKLYIKILNDFVADYKSIDCEKLNFDEFKRVIHTIKGLSASFGAVLLNDISKKIDKTEDKSMLPQLQEELKNVISEIEKKLKTDTLVKNNVTKESLSLQKRNALFIELKNAIESEMPNECKEIIIKINNYQLLAKDEILYDKIKKLINKYQFEEAGELLNEDGE